MMTLQRKYEGFRCAGFGGREILPELITQYSLEEIIIAIPLEGSVIREIVAMCRNLM